MPEDRVYVQAQVSDGRICNNPYYRVDVLCGVVQIEYKDAYFMNSHIYTSNTYSIITEYGVLPNSNGVAGGGVIFLFGVVKQTIQRHIQNYYQPNN